MYHREVFVLYHVREVTRRLNQIVSFDQVHQVSKNYKDFLYLIFKGFNLDENYRDSSVKPFI